MNITSNWLDWYNLHHEKRCQAAGSKFEDYVTTILEHFHDDFMNPEPVGRYGDAGCDGLAELGTVLYACYGQRPTRSQHAPRNAEDELSRKIHNDFTRCKECWPSLLKWRFVTNAQVGPKANKALIELQQQHREGTERPIEIHIWNSLKLWKNVVSTLDPSILNIIFPGAPGIANLELSDLTPLLKELGHPSQSGDDLNQEICPVPEDKMDFNKLPHTSKIEFNEGRHMASRINRWYEGISDPDLYDSHGESFKKIYQDIRKITEDPSEILERIYIAIAGENFRQDRKRANATYAIAAYFFDSCHYFEIPS